MGGFSSLLQLNFISVSVYLYSCIHLSCFLVLAIVNNSAVNMRLQIYLWDSDCIPLRYMSKSGMDLSYGTSIFLFYFIFFWGAFILYSREAAAIYISTNVYRGSFFSKSLTKSDMCFSIFYNSHIKVVNWYLILILIYILLMTSDVKQRFMFLLAIWMSYLGKGSSVHFSIKLFISQSNCSFLLLSWISSLYG